MSWTAIESQHFFVAASKTYAYLTAAGKEVFKAKGLSINSSNQDIFALVSIQELIHDSDLVKIVCNPMKIFRMKGSWSATSKPQNKIIRPVHDKRRI